VYLSALSAELSGFSTLQTLFSDQCNLFVILLTVVMPDLTYPA
jgi:hypothetical protein